MSLTVDWVAAALITVEIVKGVPFHQKVLSLQ